MIKKLKQKRGETLIETLFSMMIVVLCIGLLSSAIMAAANINRQTRELDEKYNEELNAVEGRTEGVSKTEKDVVISFQPADGSSAYTEDATVIVYGDEDSAFLSYDYEGDAP